MPIHKATWITRETTTVRHLRGLLQGLESQGELLDFAEVRIMTVSADSGHGVEIPGEFYKDGIARAATEANLPPQGLVVLDNSDV